MAADDDAFYAGGHSDGVSDALATLHRLKELNPKATMDQAIKAIRQADAGWITCGACDGDGENHKPTHGDVALAVMGLMGARVHPNPANCRTCHGEGIVPPPKVAS